MDCLDLAVFDPPPPPPVQPPGYTGGARGCVTLSFQILYKIGNNCGIYQNIFHNCHKIISGVSINY